MIKDTPALLKIIDAQHKDQLAMIAKKNSDYAQRGPFENFEASAYFTDTTVDQSFMFLLATKLTRAKNLLTKKAAVEGEPLEDTLQDFANYANLWLAYRKHGK